MKLIELAASTKEYIRAQVKAYDANGNVSDPTGATVQWAFTLGNNDVQEADWVDGDWETGVDGTGTTSYYGRVMVGVGGVFPLTASTEYTVWLRVNGVTEIPVKLLGSLRVV